MDAFGSLGATGARAGWAVGCGIWAARVDGGETNERVGWQVRGCVCAGTGMGGRAWDMEIAEPGGGGRRGGGGVDGDV